MIHLLFFEKEMGSFNVRTHQRTDAHSCTYSVFTLGGHNIYSFSVRETVSQTVILSLFQVTVCCPDDFIYLFVCFDPLIFLENALEILVMTSGE